MAKEMATGGTVTARRMDRRHLVRRLLVRCSGSHSLASRFGLSIPPLLRGHRVQMGLVQLMATDRAGVAAEVVDGEEVTIRHTTTRRRHTTTLDPALTSKVTVRHSRAGARDSGQVR